MPLVPHEKDIFYAPHYRNDVNISDLVSCAASQQLRNRKKVEMWKQNNELKTHLSEKLKILFG